MDDPYRTSQQVGTCPRCGNSTEGDGEAGRLVCVRGCGEWYPRTYLKDDAWRIILSRPVMNVRTDWPWGPAACPTCRTEMKIGQLESVRFDFCAEHGVWLDAGEIQRFAEVLGRS
jgi:Zn-finger nucleic acid-binding protein